MTLICKRKWTNGTTDAIEVQESQHCVPLLFQDHEVALLESLEIFKGEKVLARFDKTALSALIAQLRAGIVNG